MQAYIDGDFTSVPNGTTSAGYFVPGASRRPAGAPRPTAGTTAATARQGNSDDGGGNDDGGGQPPSGPTGSRPSGPGGAHRPATPAGRSDPADAELTPLPSDLDPGTPTLAGPARRRRWFETDAAGEPVEVADLDAAGVLALLEQRKLDARAAERGKLRLAAQWCVLHPATADTGAATWAGASLLGGDLDGDESLGGDGTPAVAAFAPEPLAATLGVATTTGMKLIADALDLHHRLPRIWRLVERSRSSRTRPATSPRPPTASPRPRPATSTSSSPTGSPPARWRAIETAVAHAIAKYHPELLDEREKRGQAVLARHPAPPRPERLRRHLLARHHRRHPRPDRVPRPRPRPRRRTSRPSVTPTTLEVRKAKALGVIASQQAQLDLTTLLGSGRRRASRPAAGAAAEAQDPALPPPRPSPTSPPHGCATATARSRGTGREARRRHPDPDQGVGRPLPASPSSPSSTWTARDAVDGHDPPAWMRELVILRDGHCVFPWCHHRRPRPATSTTSTPTSRSTTADHRARPSPANLAPLCRRHHRCKTSGRWRYRRRPDGTYEWHGPHGRTYLVTPHGTIELTSN